MAANIQGNSNPLRQKPLSDIEQKALSDSSVKTAVAKLASDVTNNASPDTIAKDKSDAFAKYQAAGGKAASIEAFGEEASRTSETDKDALRQAFGIAKKRGGTGQTEGSVKDQGGAEDAHKISGGAGAGISVPKDDSSASAKKASSSSNS